MADFTESTGLRDLLAASAANYFYYVTLHDATGGFVASDTYSPGVRGELSTGNGYTQGGIPKVLANTNGVLDTSDAVWTADGGNIGPVSYAATWVSTSSVIAGAKLVSVKDSSSSPQTATDGNPMTYTMVNPITIPTPA